MTTTNERVVLFRSNSEAGSTVRGHNHPMHSLCMACLQANISKIRKNYQLLYQSHPFLWADNIKEVASKNGTVMLLFSNATESCKEGLVDTETVAAIRNSKLLGCSCAERTEAMMHPIYPLQTPQEEHMRSESLVAA